jgi:hypothetical protein
MGDRCAETHVRSAPGRESSSHNQQVCLEGHYAARGPQRRARASLQTDVAMRNGSADLALLAAASSAPDPRLARPLPLPLPLPRAQRFGAFIARILRSGRNGRGRAQAQLTVVNDCQPCTSYASDTMQTQRRRWRWPRPRRNLVVLVEETAQVSARAEPESHALAAPCEPIVAQAEEHVPEELPEQPCTSGEAAAYEQVETRRRRPLRRLLRFIAGTDCAMHQAKRPCLQPSCMLYASEVRHVLCPCRPAAATRPRWERHHSLRTSHERGHLCRVLLVRSPHHQVVSRPGRPALRLGLPRRGSRGDRVSRVLGRLPPACAQGELRRRACRAWPRMSPACCQRTARVPCAMSGCSLTDDCVCDGLCLIHSSTTMQSLRRPWPCGPRCWVPGPHGSRSPKRSLSPSNPRSCRRATTWL